MPGPQDVSEIFNVMSSKVKVKHAATVVMQKSCEIDSSWNAEKIWTSTYTNTSYNQTLRKDYVFKVMSSKIKVTVFRRKFIDRRFVFDFYLISIIK